jgi:hypothetical protein
MLRYCRGQHAHTCEDEVMSDRVAELEAQIEDIYAQVAGWIKDGQEVFPKAKGMRDIFFGIKELQKKLESYKARMRWMDKRIYYAEWYDSKGRHSQQQPADEGYWDKETMSENFDFSEFIHRVQKEEKS